MNNIVAWLVGIVFGFGLALSGMTHTEKVLGFLDVAGAWDASLLLVLGGAVGVTIISFHFVRKLAKPVFASSFLLSEAKKVDRELIVGAALFGIGWGISGYCPGPAIALIASPNWELGVFLPSLLAGYALQHYLSQRRPAAAPSEKVFTCG